MRRIVYVGLGAAGIAAALFIVCEAGVAFAPPAVAGVWCAVLGIPPDTLSRGLAWDHYAVGLVVWTTGTALLVAGATWLFERVPPKEPRPVRS